jgi:hypothetical protein
MPRRTNYVAWRPYLIGAAVHAVLGAAAYVVLVGLAMGAADGGMLEAPFWLRAFFWVVVLITLPFAYLVGGPILYLFGPVLFFLAFLANSVLLAAILRWTSIRIRNRAARPERHW